MSTTMVNKASTDILSQIYKQDELPDIVYKRGYLSQEALPELFVKEKLVDALTGQVPKTLFSGEKVLQFFSRTQQDHLIPGFSQEF